MLMPITTNVREEVKAEGEALNRTRDATQGLPYPGPLFQFCHHDHRGTPLLPDHSPEVPERFWERALRGDIGVLLPVAIYVVGVHIVTSWDACKTGILLSEVNISQEEMAWDTA